MNYILSYFFALMFTFGPASNSEKTVSGATGLQFSSQFLNVRLFSDIPKTPFSELSYYASAQTWTEFFDYPSWGVSLSLPPAEKKQTQNFKLSAGMISYSGSFSKLKNPPQSATANPLRQSFSFSPGLHATLPSSSYSASSHSACLSYKKILELKRISKSDFTAETAFFEDASFCASSSFSANFSQSVKFKTSASGGRFFLKNNSTTLMKAGGGFSPGWFYAGIFENSFQSPLLKINISAGIHQTPWNTSALWTSGSIRSAIGIFLLDTSFFAVPTEKKTPRAAVLIGADSSPCRTIAQGAINPQIAVGQFKFGICALASYKITSTKNPTALCSGKFSFGTSYKNKNFYCRAETCASNLLLRGTPPTKSAAPAKNYSASFNSRINSTSCVLSSSVKAQHIPSISENSAAKQLYSADISICPGKKRILSTTGGIDIAIKNGKRYSTTADAGITVRLAVKSLKCTLKCAVKGCF